MMRLTGTMICPPDAADAVRAALPEHVRLTTAEPGCQGFDVTETAPGVFSVSERFVDRAVYDAHQTRTRASDWWRVTSHLSLEFELIEA